MSVLSKPLYTIVDVGDRNKMVEGFNTKYGEDVKDVHFWCEDEYGRIYDTTPISPHPSGSTQFAYLKWDNQKKSFDEYSESAWKRVFRNNPRLTDTPTTRCKFPKMMFREGDYNRPLCCHMNSHALSSHHPHLKVVVGSLGFKVLPGLVDIKWGQ